jgi:hypothetical protein
MAKLNWPKKERMESAPGTKRKHSSIMGGANINEALGEINTKEFGHVKKVAKSLHGSDPYKAAHKF